MHAFKPQQRYLVYDALRNELVPLQVTSSTNCPVCSPDLGVLGLGDLEPMPDYRRGEQVELPSPSLMPAPDAANGEDGEVRQLVTPSPAGLTDRKQRTRRLQAAMEEREEDWL